MEIEELVVDYDWDDDVEESLIDDDFDAEAEFDYRLSGLAEAKLLSI